MPFPLSAVGKHVVDETFENARFPLGFYKNKQTKNTTNHNNTSNA